MLTDSNVPFFTDKEIELSKSFLRSMQRRAEDLDVRGDTEALLRSCIAQEATLIRIMYYLNKLSPVLVSEANKQGETNPTNTVPPLNSNGHSINCMCKYCPR